MTCALRYARAAPALAMSYISVVLTIIYGYFIFHEVGVHPYLPPLHAAVIFSMQPNYRIHHHLCWTLHRSVCFKGMLGG